MEERLATLEADVRHVRSDVAEMKVDIRRIDAKVDDVKDSVAALRVETKDSISALRIEMAALEGRSKDCFAALEGRMKDSFSAVEASLTALKIGRWRDKFWWFAITVGVFGNLVHSLGVI